MFRNRQAWVFIIGMIVMLGAAVYGIFIKPPIPDDATFKEEYALVLTDYNGNKIPLSDFRREVLIVYMWASWCTYCGDELRNLAQLKQQYGEDVQILAVNRAEALVTAKEFTDGLGLNDSLTFLLDENDALFKEIAGYAMPETVFIGDRGEILFHQRGPIQIQEVDKHIQELLAQ